jgi:hypothetical protein
MIGNTLRALLLVAPCLTLASQSHAGPAVYAGALSLQFLGNFPTGGSPGPGLALSPFDLELGIVEDGMAMWMNIHAFTAARVGVDVINPEVGGAIPVLGTETGQYPGIDLTFGVPFIEMGDTDLGPTLSMGIPHFTSIRWQREGTVDLRLGLLSATSLGEDWAVVGFLSGGLLTHIDDLAFTGLARAVFPIPVDIGMDEGSGILLGAGLRAEYWPDDPQLNQLVAQATVGIGLAAFE